MLKRKAYQRLVDWKKSRCGQTALLIEGARRVGKSTLAEEFGKSEYRSYLRIDFFNAPEEVKGYFEELKADLGSLFLYLSAYYGVTLYPRESLIILDEVQLFPLARGLIKYLVNDGRYDYLETGSLVSIKVNTKNIVVPSEEEPFSLDPLDFEEFCTALGEEPLNAAIKNAAASLLPLPDAIHRKAMRLWREYLLVGGMPAIVADYATQRNFGGIDEKKRLILNLYRNDIARYAKGYEYKVISIFDQLPGQLSKHEKKFTLSSLGSSARMRNYEEAFYWLDDAKISNPCFASTDPDIDLRMNQDQSSVKCYLADTGLLVSHAFPQGVLSDATYRDILLGKININEGMLVENAVAQALHARGNELLFYSCYDREDANKRMEIDFLVVRGYADAGNKPRVCPIEVKSSSRYGINSLDKFKARFGKRVGTQYVLHPKQLKVEGDRRFLPLYMAHCI